MRKHLKKFWTWKKELLVGALSAALLFGSAGILWMASLKLPDLGSFETRVVSQSTKIYDRTGSILLYDINQGIRRTVVKNADISRNIKNAAVAIEDAEFYQHHGIKPTAIIRAIVANLGAGGYSQGGSTITQQVIKNALLTQEKSIGRKLKEWILSIKLEKEMSKDDILTLYLNESPYGGNVYGVEEAAKNFFGKHASEASLVEAAYLAALPNAPTYYSPYGGNRQALEKRKNLVLQQMLKNNFISDDEYKEALAEKVEFKALEDTSLKAPHFVMYIKEELEKMYGASVMETRGYKVFTTLDYNLEQKAEEIVRKYAFENEKNYNASNAAITAIDSATGEILVMVGSRDYFDVNIEGNFNIATARRQPGSSIKPFIYAAAFEKGYTAETVLFDVKTEFSTLCKPDGSPIKEEDADKCYMPGNYDEKYRGPITLREALAQSINIPSIKTLYLTGIRNAIDLANSMGIESLNDPDRYGLTLVLGGGEVSLLELTGGYAVFSNDGVKNSPHGILKIETSEGNPVFVYSPEPKQALESEIARTITDILSDNEARAPSYGYNSPLYFPGYNVAAKTGTTNDYRDAWILGYTPRIAVGAWAGNNDNSPMEKKVAGFIVAPMWNAFMQEVIHSQPVENFREPEKITDPMLKPALRGFWQGGESYYIDSRNNQPASDQTPEQFRKEKIIPNVHTILYWLEKNDPRGPRPIKPENDSQFNLWEEPIQKWVLENNINAKLQLEAPAERPIVPTPLPKIIPLSASIISPNQTQNYLSTDKIMIELNLSGSYAPIRVEYYLNGQLLGSTVQPPFQMSFVPKEISMLQKYNNIRAVVYSTAGEKFQTSSSFVVSF